MSSTREQIRREKLENRRQLRLEQRKFDEFNEQDNVSVLDDDKEEQSSFSERRRERREKIRKKREKNELESSDDDLRSRLLKDMEEHKTRPQPPHRRLTETISKSISLKLKEAKADVKALFNLDTFKHDISLEVKQLDLKPSVSTIILKKLHKIKNYEKIENFVKWLQKLAKQQCIYLQKPLIYLKLMELQKEFPEGTKEIPVSNELIFQILFPTTPITTLEDKIIKDIAKVVEVFIRNYINKKIVDQKDTSAKKARANILLFIDHKKFFDGFDKEYKRYHETPGLVHDIAYTIECDKGIYIEPLSFMESLIKAIPSKVEQCFWEAYILSIRNKLDHGLFKILQKMYEISLDDYNVLLIFILTELSKNYPLYYSHIPSGLITGDMPDVTHYFPADYCKEIPCELFPKEEIEKQLSEFIPIRVLSNFTAEHLSLFGSGKMKNTLKVAEEKIEQSAKKDKDKRRCLIM